MISFNSLGFESQTGEPNTWTDRVTTLKAYEPPQVVSKALWQELSGRGMEAAFLLHEWNEAAASAGRGRAVEEIGEEARAHVMHMLKPESEKLAVHWPDEHTQAKLKRAKRRERNLQDKDPWGG